MGAHFIYNNKYFILFLACLISRISTSIFFIEDIDSLRFAYSIVDEYNILKLQPHFPGYAVFCFLANVLNHVFGNLGMIFSLIGAISTFLIIFFSLQLLNFNIESKEGLFTAALIFFNPMLWLMSNRYMPDLMGLSILIMTFYFLCQKNQKDILIGLFLIGILAGVRISYVPFLFIITLLIIIKNKNKLLLLFSIFFGIMIWLIPMGFITGFENLYIMGIKHMTGHFTEYGGTIITETDWKIRLQYFFHTIWSDGFGGYWINRSIFTMILSLLLIPFIILLIKNIKSIINGNFKIQQLIISTFIYIIWILPFQNIIHKSRHVMPIILVLILLFSIIYSLYFVKLKGPMKLYPLLFILIMAYVAIHLSIQHKTPTAINKISQYLKNNNQPMLIISMPLINYYLKAQNLNAEYMDIENNFELINENLNNINKNIIMIGDFKEKMTDHHLWADTTFYHNPYVNRMWSNIKIYSNRKF